MNYAAHIIQRAAALLTFLFHALGLRKRWRGLRVVHGGKETLLFLGLQIGQLHSGVKGNFLFIHHVQNFGNEIGQADIAADGFPTHASVFAHFLRSQLRHNLCRS